MPGGELPSNAPREGDVIGHDYRVGGLLGTGGMGYVLGATRISNGERVAIKMLLPHVAGLPDVVARFMREARSAKAIDSVHSARVFEVGETGDGAPFMVMERLDGVDLKTLLREKKRVPAEQAVDWILEACEGIAAAHRKKIIHRDLKPANLFLATMPTGTVVKVLDFGISKSLAPDTDEPLHLTQTSEMLGSPYYMSPEQIKSSRTVDERGDIWALGVILHELVTGRLPFSAPTLAELCVAILTSEAPRIDEGGEHPRELADVVAKCLRPAPLDRWDSVASLATALAPFGSRAARQSAQRISSSVLVTTRLPTVLEEPDDMQATVRVQSSPGLSYAAPAPAPPMPPARTPMPSTFDRSATGFAQTASPPKRASTAWIAIAIAALVAIAGALGVGALVMKRKASAASEEPPMTAATPGTAPEPAPAASAPADAPEPAPAASAPAPASAAASASASAPSSSAKPRGKAPPKKGLFGSEH